MKKSARSVYLRYEFSNEAGKPEGGDIFEFANVAEVQEMVAQIMKVADSDDVSVNLTMGTEKPFFGFLKNVGITRQMAQKEMVPTDLAPLTEKKTTKKSSTTKKKTSKKK